jgi:hypothetical protein
MIAALQKEVKRSNKHNKTTSKETKLHPSSQRQCYLHCDPSVVASGSYEPFARDVARGDCEKGVVSSCWSRTVRAVKRVSRI